MGFRQQTLTNMQIKCPSNLFFRRQETLQFDFASLASGGSGLRRSSQWQALAMHLGQEIELEFEDLAVFDTLSRDGPCALPDLHARFGSERVDRLVGSGLLLGDHSDHEAWCRRNDAVDQVGWWSVAALAQVFGRWQGVDVSLDEERYGRLTLAKKITEAGLPPAEAGQARHRDCWHPLPAPTRTALDELMAGRSTCRNFDPDFVLPVAELSDLLHRVFGAQAQQVLAPGAVALKKNSPSGGGLHPIEAYLLVRQVDGVAPGLYHYHCTAHALEPMQLLSAEAAARLAHELVAGQAWFAEAPVLVLMAARFERSYWKYRNHGKAWRVIQLEAGHLSQNLYLSATERGFGAFVTGAINDDCAERLFELDGIAIGAIAVCGFGLRAKQIRNVELDPLGKAVR